MNWKCCVRFQVATPFPTCRMDRYGGDHSGEGEKGAGKGKVAPE